MRTRCETCAVRHSSVCGALSGPAVTALNAIARPKSVMAGQTIFRLGEETDHFANIIDGVVRLGRMDAEGRQVTVGLQFASDFIGRPFRSTVSFDVVALTDVRLCLFPSKSFDALVKAYTELEHRLFERTLDELDAAREWLAIVGQRSAQQKVAAFLVLMANRSLTAACGNHGPQDATTFDLPLSRQDIASFLGLTIETVSRQFTQLKRDGVIALPSLRTVEVVDDAGLRDRAA